MKTIGVKSALLFGGFWISMALAQPAKLAIVIDDIVSPERRRTNLCATKRNFGGDYPVF
ncbi:hypothetical protein AAUPMC_15730, partial [Pasteurella multocida subsp. multocida str. Anand1_cattle]